MKVECINDKVLEGNDVGPDLILGKSYVVLQIIKDHRGNEHYDVGLRTGLNYISSYETREHLPRNSDHTTWCHWCHPSRFKFLD